jgi:hypothetical protein
MVRLVFLCFDPMCCCSLTERWSKSEYTSRARDFHSYFGSCGTLLVNTRYPVRYLSFMFCCQTWSSLWPAFGNTHTHTHTHTHRLRRILCIILWTILFQSQSWVTLLCNVSIVIKLCTFWKGKICFICFASLENIMSASPHRITFMLYFTSAYVTITPLHPSLQVHWHSC